MTPRNSLMDLESYDPANVLDAIRNILALDSDKELSEALGLAPSMVCRVRAKIRPITGVILLAMHDASGISIKRLRALMGDTRRFF